MVNEEVADRQAEVEGNPGQTAKHHHEAHAVILGGLRCQKRLLNSECVIYFTEDIFIECFKAGVGNLWPMGQLRPTELFHAARRLIARLCIMCTCNIDIKKFTFHLDFF